MSPLSHALRYASLGHPVVPQRGKLPITRLVPHGVLDASTDPEVIRRWFRQVPDADIGLAAKNFLAIDIDARSGGLGQMAELTKTYGRFPRTPVQKSGGGGYHYLFANPDFPVIGKLGRGIDVITGNRMITVSPTVHPSGVAYRWLVPPTEPLAPVPDWLAKIIRRIDVPKPAIDFKIPADVVERARAYLAQVDPAISGSGGHQQTFYACQVLVRGFALDDHNALPLLTEWNARCCPPWEPWELARKLENARRTGRMAFGQLLDRRCA